MPTQLTPEQALAYLDNVAAQYKGTRQDHLLLTEALSIFKALILQSSNSEGLDSLV